MPQPAVTALRCLDILLSVAFQTTCLICEKVCGARPLCENCSVFEQIPASICARCGEPAPQAIHECGRCSQEFLLGIQRCRSSYLLNDNCRHVLHTIKYRKHKRLLDLFKESVQHLEFPSDAIVVPVPMHWKKRLERGFNQSEILADWFSARFAVDKSHLRKKKRTTPQVFLTKQERKQNQGEFYFWDSSHIPESVILVDDVLTTGATLEACAKALKRAGTKEIYAWTLFRTIARHQSGHL